MARFQLTISKTINLDTNDWPYEGQRDYLLALQKVKDKNAGTASYLAELAMAAMLKDEDCMESLDIEIEAKDRKVVCIDSRPPELAPEPAKPATKEPPSEPPAKQNAPQVAPKPEADAAAKARQEAAARLKEGDKKPSVEPAPKIEQKGPSAIQGARDSKQLKE
jgi:hypothetical protein